MVNTDGLSRSGWSTKRKSKMPLRSLSRLSSTSTSSRSSPTDQEAVPGVMIRFVGEMTKIDDAPAFSLKIIHEQRNGSSLTDPNASILRSSLSSQSQSQSFQSPLLLKLPSHVGGRSRRTRSSRTSSVIDYREDVDDSDAKPSSSDSESSIGASFKSEDHLEDLGRGRRRQNSSGLPLADRGGRKKSCSSCGTKKTPYWREGWEPSIILCNACGIRYQKYKRYCARCIAIARKDDKGRLHCPECHQRL
jgi:hypothetical protein